MSSSSSTAPTQDDLHETIFRLLERAGRDPRATPRLLRNKAEQRLKLAKDALKPRREEIKRLIMSWDEQENARLGAEIKLLVKLTKAAGIGPQIYADLRELSDRLEQKKLLVERLQSKGLVFSDPPTEAEIAAAKSEHDRKKDLEGIDASNILEDKKRRAAEDGKRKNSKKRVSSDDEVEEEDKEEANKEGRVKEEKRKKYDEDEEAEF